MTKEMLYEAVAQKTREIASLVREYAKALGEERPLHLYFATDTDRPQKVSFAADVTFEHLVETGKMTWEKLGDPPTVFRFIRDENLRIDE